MYKIFLKISLMFLCFVLISCKYNIYSLKTNSQELLRWKQHQERLSKISNYQVRGVLVSSLYKKKKINFRFFFQKIDHKYHRLILTDAIGFKNIVINVVEFKECCMHNKRENCISSNDFQMLIKKILNIDVPFKCFQEWMIGLARKNTNFSLTSDGYLKKIKYQYHDQNFKILYKDYFYSQTPVLPKVIKIYYNNYCHFNIKIYSWII